MANFKIILLMCGLIAGVLAKETTIKIDPEPEKSSPVPPQPTSPSPNVTTTGPITTTTKTTTSAKPITTTTTTSPAPPSPNTTTTTTTTTEKPSTPAPTPNPVDPKVGNWTVNYVNTTKSCIILFVAAQIEVIEEKNKTTTVNVPDNATVRGSCEDNGTQTLILTWDQDNYLELDFEKTNTSKFDIKRINATVSLPSETGSIRYELLHEKTEFSTPLQNSYKCARKQTLNLTEENSNKTSGFLRLSHLQYQAFLNSTDNKFDSALDCEPSVTPDIVPIVVGCVLAALVVAVLAAYLFGRRRCQARGYLSM